MGPMIDMVFLLLVFFMVSAKPITPESDIPMGLPGQVSQEEAVDIPDEARIIIESRMGRLSSTSNNSIRRRLPFCRN